MVAATVYPLILRHAKPLVAAVGAHGITDLDSFDWVPHYAFWGLVPLPGLVLTAVFIASSIMHFAHELGDYGSLALHGYVGIVALQRGRHAAFNAMIDYLAFVHVPLHYARCWRNGRKPGLLLAGVATLMGAAASPRMIADPFVFGHRMQRVVIAHISHEYVLEHPQ